MAIEVEEILPPLGLEVLDVLGLNQDYNEGNKLSVTITNSDCFEPWNSIG